jgi:hypothetical protein
MMKLNGASLLPSGEGQDEGINEIGILRRFDPLTPALVCSTICNYKSSTLSRREREFMGQQSLAILIFYPYRKNQLPGYPSGKG